MLGATAAEVIPLDSSLTSYILSSHRKALPDDEELQLLDQSLTESVAAVCLKNRTYWQRSASLAVGPEHTISQLKLTDD